MKISVDAKDVSKTSDITRKFKVRVIVPGIDQSG